jgi:signal transduction histidine kinase
VLPESADISPSGTGVGSSLSRPTIRAALCLGFGLTLGLWFVAGYRLTERMSRVGAQATAINARYMRAQDLLSTARTQILLGSVIVRDALLDPDPASITGYRQHFNDTYAAAGEALAEYVPVLDSPNERHGIEDLGREIDAFHQAMLGVLDSDRRQWARQSRLLLQERVAPKRDVVIRVSEQVQALNRGAFVSQHEATSAIYQDAQRQAWIQLGLALAASLAIGAWAAVYAGRLEARLRRQRARALQMTSDLHRLSGKIVSAQEDERRMIARELHDEVGQALTAIRVELSFAQRGAEMPPAVAERLKDVRAITEGALHTIRDLSHLLHPSLLDDLGLTAALESLLAGFGRRHGLQVEVLHDHMEHRLAPELETAVYRVVQEALNNVAKHAQASACRVYLQGLPHTVLVTVEDDGSGFAADPVNGTTTHGLGLIGIRERAAQLGGSMRVDSAPGRGTRLTVELPARTRDAPGVDADAPAAAISEDRTEDSIDATPATHFSR